MCEIMPLDNRYQAIVCDPPWHYATRSPKGDGRSARKHYGTMSLDELKQLPVSQWAAPNCVLFMWACDPLLPQALELIDAWGFSFSTVGFYWVKENKKSPGLFTGLGYWTRACPEQCLLATRGRPKRKAKDVRRVIMSPRREHSRKPDEVIERIERLVDGPYLEMFARQTRPGWDAFGNETDKYDMENALFVSDQESETVGSPF